MLDRISLEQRVAAARTLSEHVAARSLLDYLRLLVIDSRPEPRRFGEIADPWQWRINAKLIPPIEAVTGMRSGYRGHRHNWLTMPRGHDKTSQLARLLSGALAFGRRPINAYAAAGDSDQAGLLTEAMVTEAKLNPWLEKRLRFSSKRVKGPGGTLHVLTADAGTSFGLRPDLVVVDEITHWRNRDLWDVLWSGAAKRPGSVFVVITNAGVLGSWQDGLRRQYLNDPAWWVYEAPPRLKLASWMSAAAIEALRLGLPPGLAKRVLDNIWIDAAEESGFLFRSDLEAAEALGRQLGLTYRLQGEPGVQYYLGIDYGPRKDRTALCVLHYDYGRKLVIVDRLDVWQGSPESPIQIARVEEWVAEADKVFNRPRIVVDLYQMEGSAQRWEMTGHIVDRFEARGGKRTYEMAENLRSLIVNGRMAWYPSAGPLPRADGSLETLLDEMLGLVLRITSYGYRFDHEAGFHDDRAVAVGMPALVAIREQDAPWIKPSPIKTPAVEPLVYEPPGIRIRRVNSGGGGRGLYGMAG